MRKWLERLVDYEYLPAVRKLENTPAGQAQAQEWAEWMKEQWSNHGLKSLSQQRNLMTDTRNALKHELGEDHFALESMSFSKAEWTQINEPIQEQAAKRNENQQFLDQPEAIVERGSNLLLSREWAEVAAALALLTGRRSSEILSTAEFEYKTPYSVTFTGALKRGGESQVLSFEIPTLTGAQQVITALDKMRKWLPTKGMSAQAVNQKYGEAVARSCDRNFADLIPLRAGRDNLYSHLFRTVYARIATHWFAPSNVADVEFMAAIQGHYAVLDEQNPKLRRSLMSSRHYNDYKIGDGKGNIDGRQGIKLGQPGVDVIEVFKSQVATEETVARDKEKSVRRRKISSLRLFQDERDRWDQVLDKLAPEDNQPQKLSALLQWAEEQLATPPPQPEVTAAPEAPVEPQPPAEEHPIPESAPPFFAMEQAWEKIGTLTEVLTRLATRLEQQETEPARRPPADRVTIKHPPRSASAVSEAPPAAKEPAHLQPARPGRSSGEAEEKINYAIDEIIKHNSLPDLPHEQKWAITFSVLKAATKSYQGVIHRVLEHRQREVEQHHELHGLGKFHNNLHRRTGVSITDVVRFQYS